MFNATDLLKQWNKSSKMLKISDDKYNMYISGVDEVQGAETIEYYKEVFLEQDEDILHRGNSTYVKSRASRGANAGTFMYPFLFIKFAMWLNPRFELEVINKIHYLCC